MGKGYVLKGKNGQVCGFIMQTGRDLSYRITTHFLKKPLTLTAVYADGERVSAEVKDGDEHQQEASGDVLIGAYVEIDEVLLMDTGKDARNAYYNRKNSFHQEARTDKSECKKDVPKEVCSTKSPVTDSFVKERRWPPPPCVSNARFLDGRWVDQSIGV